MPGREKPLDLQAVSDLWGAIIGFPLFFGMFFGVLLVPFFDGGVPEDKHWPWLGVLLLVGAFLGWGGTAIIRPRLSELARRGKWVPPGTPRHPVLVPTVLALFLMAVGAAVVVGTGSLVVWLGTLGCPPLLATALVLGAISLLVWLSVVWLARMVR